MKKYLLPLMTVSTLLVASTATYEMSVEVEATKPSGHSWDIAGGAPDIRVKIDGMELTFLERCRDTYKCTTTYFNATNKQQFYIEVYDRDAAADDLIGKGECRVGQVCKLGSSVVRVSEVKKPLVLADARYDTKSIEKESIQMLDRLLLQSVKNEVDIEILEAYINRIEMLQRYGYAFDQSMVNKTKQLIQRLKTNKQVPTFYLERLKKVLKTSEIEVVRVG